MKRLGETYEVIIEVQIKIWTGSWSYMRDDQLENIWARFHAFKQKWIIMIILMKLGSYMPDYRHLQLQKWYKMDPSICRSHHLPSSFCAKWIHFTLIKTVLPNSPVDRHWLTSLPIDSMSLAWLNVTWYPDSCPRQRAPCKTRIVLWPCGFFRAWQSTDRRMG